MGRNHIEMNDFETVKPNGVATCDIDTVWRYGLLHLKITHTKGGTPDTLMTAADMKTHLEKIHLVASGTNETKFGKMNLIEVSGKHYIDTYLTPYKIPVPDGYLPIVFEIPYLDNPMNEKHYGLGTKNLKNCSIRISLDNTVVDPAITGEAEIYDGPNEDFGQFIMLTEGNFTVGSTGPENIKDEYLTGKELGIKALHFDTDQIEGLELRVGSQEIYKTTSREMIGIINDKRSFRTGGRTAVAGYTHIDMAGNSAGNIKNTVGWRNVKTTLEMSGTGEVWWIAETVFDPVAAQSL